MKTIICYGNGGGRSMFAPHGAPAGLFSQSGTPDRAVTGFVSRVIAFFIRLHYSSSLGIVSIGVADAVRFRFIERRDVFPASASRSVSRVSRPKMIH
jgi:hypothetical protein